MSNGEMQLESTTESNGVATESRPNPVLEVRNLHRYFGRLKAVNNVSFQAMAGQVIGFIGPNGSGKTTTMRILATLDTPTAGDCFICGYSVVDDPDQVRRMMGFMPDAFGRYSNMSVTEYIDFYARAYGFRGQKRRDAMERVMTFTELDRIPDKPIDTLSKGLSQRLGLGRTLIHDPQVLILDEPAAGLDPRARVELRELILLLSTQLNKTVLISSHILTELGEICDSACIIEAGRVLAWGTIDEISKQQRDKTGETVTKTILVRLLGETHSVENWLHQQPFVIQVANAGPGALSFIFNGDDAQRVDLLKRMIQNEYPVIDFQSKTETLEDAFMAITKGVMQ